MSQILPTGDCGQRYEHTCDDGTGKRFIIGWSNNPGGFANTVNWHPVWCDYQSRDREADQESTL